MLSWIINILGLIGSWHYTNLESDSFFQNMILPILVAVFLISLFIKCVFLLGPASGRGGHGGDGGFFGGSGDGDGGCGGDGGGC